MKENNRTLMLAYPKKDIEFGINLIEEGLIELSKIFQQVLERKYREDDIKRGEMVISNIKEYINNIKNLETYNDISNSQIIGCDYKPKLSALDVRNMIDDSFWDAIS